MAESLKSMAAMAASTLAQARQLAAAHPEARLPCPACAASLKGAKLESHLAKLHPQQLPGDSGPLRMVGVDKRSFYVLIGLLVVWGIAVTITFAWKVALTDLRLAIIGSTLMISMGLLTAAALGVFKAHLEVEGEQLRLRWLFGLASRTLSLPAKVEAGAAMATEMKSTGLSAVDGGAKDVKFGAYLRISNGRSAITVVAKKSPKLGQHWAPSGWTPGKKRSVWDITVDPLALVALEYHLAQRGQLRLIPG